MVHDESLSTRQLVSSEPAYPRPPDRTSRGGEDGQLSPRDARGFRLLLLVASPRSGVAYTFPLNPRTWRVCSRAGVLGPNYTGLCARAVTARQVAYLVVAPGPLRTGDRAKRRRIILVNYRCLYYRFSALFWYVLAFLQLFILTSIFTTHR